jgi:hypothetical protein
MKAEEQWGYGGYSYHGAFDPAMQFKSDLLLVGNGTFRQRQGLAAQPPAYGATAPAAGY